MRGRDNGTPEGAKAAEYVAEQFRKAGLEPGGKDGWFHAFEWRGIAGRNVVGLLEGERRDEYVVVAAHHDARGVLNGKVQNGADDNATGVAAVIELARSFATSKPARSMLFVSFDAEEDGLVGSREFVRAELYPAASFVAMFVFDLVGGTLIPGDENRLYALGAEHSPELWDRVGRAGALEVVRSGIHLIEPIPGMARSDYHSFREKGVPFVFFSTGTPWYYHTEHDDVEVVDFGKLERVVRAARGVIAETVAGSRPRFVGPRVPPEDLEVVKSSLDRALALPMDAALRDSATRMREELGALREPDAKRLQQAMMLLFRIVRAQRKP
jgi:Zn-dependent M28 family amino/carboxypeptidase